MRTRFALTVIALATASVLCIALGEFYRAQRRFDAVVGVLLGLWLIFFPNAPYMLTDFIHLGKSESAPVWYDALMLSSFAWTALLLGFASLYLVQLVARRVVGLAWSWVGVAGALALASFGVYLGRFVRFNSWDVLVRPGRVLDVISNQIENPLRHPLMIAVLLALTAFLLVGYTVLYAFAGMRLELESER